MSREVDQDNFLATQSSISSHGRTVSLDQVLPLDNVHDRIAIQF